MVGNYIKWILLFCWSLLSVQTWAGPNIQSWQTSSGSRVLYVSAPDLPMLDIRMVFDAGSARDGGKPGLALLANAVMTDAGGPWNVNQIAERLEAVGAELGAGSQRDMGWVSMRTLTEKRPKTVALETLKALISKPHFNQTDMERSRKAMLISLSRVEQSPGSIASREFWAALYGKHPYASYKGGTEASVRGMMRSDLTAFYNRYYTAKNAVIALVGAIDRAEAESIAEQLTEDLPKGEKASALTAVSALQAPIDQRLQFASTQSHLLLGQPGVYRGDPDYFVLYVGNHILGGNGLVSTLSEEVREKRGLSYSVYSYFSPMRRQGPFILGAQTKNVNVPEALRVIHETLSNYIENGPSQEELTAAKQNITGGFPLKISSNGSIVEYLAMIGFYGLPLDYLDTFVSKVESVTLQQIKDAFKRRLQPEKFVTVVVGDVLGTPQN